MLKYGRFNSSNSYQKSRCSITEENRKIEEQNFPGTVLGFGEVF